MICFFSFVFGLCLYLSLCLCLVSIFSYFRQWHNPTKIYSTLLTKTFLYFTSFFFFSRVPIIGQTNTTQLTTLKYSLISTNSTLSIYLSYLYNKRERVPNTNTESQIQKAKKKKKKEKKKTTTGSQDRQAQIQFTITESPTSVHHSSVKTQTPQVHDHKHRLLDSEIHK